MDYFNKVLKYLIFYFSLTYSYFLAMSLEEMHSDGSEGENKPFSKDTADFVNEMACLLLSFAVTSGFLQYQAIVL